MRVRTQPPRARYHARDTTVLTHTLIATLGPMLTLLPVLAVLFAPWHRRAPVAIKIDGRHYRGAPGTIEHEEQKMTPKQTNETTADVGLTSRRALNGALAAAPAMPLPVLARRKPHKAAVDKTEKFANEDNGAVNGRAS